jgi:hypothetical protein
MPGYAQTSPFAYVFVFFSCAKFRHVLAELKDEVSRGDTLVPYSQSDYFVLTLFFKPNQRFGEVWFCRGPAKFNGALMLYEPLLCPVISFPLS